MTIADDLRDAAVTLNSMTSRCTDPNCPTCLPQRELASLATRLRQNADAIERIEREMREWAAGPEGSPWMIRLADALRGDTT